MLAFGTATCMISKVGIAYGITPANIQKVLSCSEIKTMKCWHLNKRDTILYSVVEIALVTKYRLTIVIENQIRHGSMCEGENGNSSMCPVKILVLNKLQ